LPQNRLDLLLWLTALVSYGVGDALTTSYNLAEVCVDLNPLVTQQTIILLKILIFFSLFILYLKMRKNFIPALLTVLGLIATFYNLAMRV